MRNGKWKLLVNKEQNRSELYDLESDWAEKYDVAADNPEIVHQLSKKLDAWKTSLPTTPSENGLSKGRKKVMAQKANKSKSARKARKDKQVEKKQ